MKRPSLNHTFRLVWSDRTGGFVAVSEHTSARGKKSTRAIALTLSLLALLGAPLAQAAPPPTALPTGGQVVAGAGAISQNGTTLTVTQSSGKMVANWNSFNIGAQATVNFVQPGAGSQALNRVLDSNASQIFGRLNANGQVFLLNPNGVIFGAGSQVNVGGLVASTLNMSNADFMAGRLQLSNAGGAASIVNQGNINGKVVALIAPQVHNAGVISANGGSAVLAAGDKVTLDFTGDNLLTVRIDQGAFNALVENKALIQADGGSVVMTARTADNLLSTVVNNEGVIQARTLNNVAGRILLLGDMEHGQANIAGTLDASAPNGGNGGQIETSAAKVKIADSARIVTAAALGLNGSWLIDPSDFTVAASGGDISGAALSANLAGGAVTIQTGNSGSGNGDIFVNDSVSWSANTTLTLNAYHNININQNISATGATGKVVLNYGQGAVAAGNNAVYTIAAGKNINLQAGQNFSTRLGSDGTLTNWTVITSLGALADASAAPATMTLQGMAAAGSLGGNYVLGANIDASATAGVAWETSSSIKGFAPIGSQNAMFTGKFDGLGHTIDSLYVYRLGVAPFTGMFGRTGTASVIRNVGLTNATVTQANPMAIVGGLAGENNGVIDNAYISGQVSGNTVWVGGLVGITTGNISNSHSSATVHGNSTVGGLAGASYGSAIISNSYATGNVSGGNESIGGLIGKQVANSPSWGYSFGSLASGTGASIIDSYATGTVTTGGSIGGLAGANLGGKIIRSHATGNVSGSSYVGGLVGLNHYWSNNNIADAGAISDSYATGNVTGTGYAVGGLVGYGSAPKSAVATMPFINRSYATGNVAGGNYVGGLVGWAYGAGNNALVFVNQSYASGNVSATGSKVGGLVGWNYGGWHGSAGSSVISNSFATGTVAGNDSVGGLVGMNSSGASIVNSYESGAVAGSGGNVGGLVGNNVTSSYPASVSHSFFDASVNASLAGIGGNGATQTGVSGKSTAEMQNTAIFSAAGWDIVADSRAATYPVLRWVEGRNDYVWVAPGAPLHYAVGNRSTAYGTSPALPAAVLSGGTPTASASVQVMSGNTDVTAQYYAGTLAPGSYSLTAVLSDAIYAIAANGNSAGVLTIIAPAQPPAPANIATPAAPAPAAPAASSPAPVIVTASVPSGSGTVDTAVASIIAPQTGFNGTGGTGKPAAQPQDPLASNAILPGGGSQTVVKLASRDFVTDARPILTGGSAAPLAIPRQGAMTLSSGTGSVRMELESNGSSTTLTLGSGNAANADKVLATTPALPVFTAPAGNKVDGESSVVVTDKGSALSATQAAGNGTGLTADAALTSARSGGQTPGLTASVTLADGTATNVTVSVTSDGVLVVKLPEQVEVKGNERGITLIAMAAAKDLGVAPDALRGVLIGAGGQ